MAVALACVAVAEFSYAQMSRGGAQHPSPVTSGTDSMQTELHMLTDVQRQGVDRKEENAYKAFYNQKDELDKKIQLGQEFLQKYPKSPLAEAVDAGLVNAYVAKQDWKDVYVSADSALALKPDDVDVLTTVGWVIPHVYRPDDPDGPAELDKSRNVRETRDGSDGDHAEAFALIRRTICSRKGAKGFGGAQRTGSCLLSARGFRKLRERARSGDAR